MNPDNEQSTQTDTPTEGAEAPEAPPAPAAPELTPMQQMISMQVASLRSNLALQDQDIQQITADLGRRIAARRETATTIETLATLLPAAEPVATPEAPADEAPTPEGETAVYA